MLYAGRADARPGREVAGQQASGHVAQVTDAQRGFHDLADRLQGQAAQFGAAGGR
jgi:hypothetical protein